MNSIGIKEGSVIAPVTECDCVWLTLLSNPPKYKLQKKCQKCIAKEAGQEIGVSISDADVHKIAKRMRQLEQQGSVTWR